MGKLLLLTLNEQEEKMIDKIITAISDYIQIEPMEITPAVDSGCRSLIRMKLTVRFLAYILVAYCQIKVNSAEKMLYQCNG